MSSCSTIVSSFLLLIGSAASVGSVEKELILLRELENGGFALVQTDLSSIFPLPDEAKRLEVLVGQWNIEGYLVFGGKRLRAKGVWMLSWAAAKWGILNVGEIEIEEMGVYEEVDLIGFNAGDRLYHLFSVTNTAATHDHKGKWLDEGTLSFTYEGLEEKKPYREDIEIKIISPNELEVIEIDVLAGETVSKMAISLKRELPAKII